MGVRNKGEIQDIAKERIREFGDGIDSDVCKL